MSKYLFFFFWVTTQTATFRNFQSFITGFLENNANLQHGRWKTITYKSEWGWGGMRKKFWKWITIINNFTRTRNKEKFCGIFPQKLPKIFNIFYRTGVNYRLKLKLFTSLLEKLLSSVCWNDFVHKMGTKMSHSGFEVGISGEQFLFLTFVRKIWYSV